MSQTIILDTAPDSDGVEWSLRPRFIKNGPSILIVGPDGVGKTTIAKQMSEITEIPVFKCSSEKKIFREGGGPSLAFDYTLVSFLHQTGYRFISDRSYPCEFVYSKVFGRETDWPLLNLIDDGHANIGTKILYLYSSIQPSEPDDIVPPEKYWEIVAGYDWFRAWTDCHVLSYDTAQSLHFKGKERADFDTTACMKLLGERDRHA